MVKDYWKSFFEFFSTQTKLEFSCLFYTLADTQSHPKNPSNWFKHQINNSPTNFLNNINRRIIPLKIRQNLKQRSTKCPHTLIKSINKIIHLLDIMTHNHTNHTINTITTPTYQLLEETLKSFGGLLLGE